MLTPAMENWALPPVALMCILPLVIFQQLEVRISSFAISISTKRESVKVLWLEKRAWDQERSAPIWLPALSLSH